MRDDPNYLIEKIENTDWDKIPSLIDKLVNLKEIAVKALLEQPPGIAKSRLSFVKAHVFARVGYPTNKFAMEYLVSDASNP